MTYCIKTVNKRINEKKQNPHVGFCDSTYINESIREEFIEYRDYKLIRCRELQKAYKWSDEDMWKLYNTSDDYWIDALGNKYFFDYGKGENMVVSEGQEADNHKPEHDHIIPRSKLLAEGKSESEINHHSNIRFIARKINRHKSNLTKEEFIALHGNGSFMIKYFEPKT